jgi:hypothetical protein
MVRKERLVNNAATTLSGGINSSVTSMTVVSGTGFPTEGDFRVVIDQEIILVTARAGNTMTIVRGQENSTGATHGNTAAVTAIVTQGGIDKWITDHVDPYAFVKNPSRLVDEAGVTLTSADFTILNEGTGSITDDASGAISVAFESRTFPDMVVYHKAAPSTPYTVTSHVMHGHSDTMGTLFNSVVVGDNPRGVGFREASSGKLIFVVTQPGAHMYAKQMADESDETGINYSLGPNPPWQMSCRPDYWLQIEDDGTDIFFRVSANGFNWNVIQTELRGAWFDTGPDQIFFGGGSEGDANEVMRILSWHEE